MRDFDEDDRQMRERREKRLASKFKPGDKVRMKVLIQSDDRENGIDDGSPIFPEGTIGRIVRRSRDPDGIRIEWDVFWVVEFETGHRYDVHDREMKLVRK